MGAGILAFLFSLFDYYKYSVAGISATASAWHGFFGWFAALLALAGAAAVAVHIFARQMSLPVPIRTLCVALFAVATVCVLLALAVVPGASLTGLNKGHGFAYWVSLIVIIAGLVLSFLRLKATGGSLPWEKRSTAGGSTS